MCSGTACLFSLIVLPMWPYSAFGHLCATVSRYQGRQWAFLKPDIGPICKRALISYVDEEPGDYPDQQGLIGPRVLNTPPKVPTSLGRLS